MENNSNEKSRKVKPQNSFRINHLLGGAQLKTPETVSSFSNTKETNNNKTHTQKKIDNISIYLFILLFKAPVCLFKKTKVYCNPTSVPSVWFTTRLQAGNSLVITTRTQSFRKFEEVLVSPLENAIVVLLEYPQENLTSSGCVV